MRKKLKMHLRQCFVLGRSYWGACSLQIQPFC